MKLGLGLSLSGVMSAAAALANWILITGSWDDTKPWDDTQLWKDS